jgi:hypothetical protein
MNTPVWQQITLYVAIVFGVKGGAALSNAGVRRAHDLLISRGVSWPPRSGMLAIMRIYRQAGASLPVGPLAMFHGGQAMVVAGVAALIVLFAVFGFPLP